MTYFTIIVLLLPPSAFLSNFVRIDSLYGISTFLPFSLEANAEIQFPSQVSERLIAVPSLNLSPSVPDFAARSLKV